MNDKTIDKINDPASRGAASTYTFSKTGVDPIIDKIRVNS